MISQSGCSILLMMLVRIGPPRQNVPSYIQCSQNSHDSLSRTRNSPISKSPSIRLVYLNPCLPNPRFISPITGSILTQFPAIHIVLLHGQDHRCHLHARSCLSLLVGHASFDATTAYCPARREAKYRYVVGLRTQTSALERTKLLIYNPFQHFDLFSVSVRNV